MAQRSSLFKKEKVIDIYLGQEENVACNGKKERISKEHISPVKKIWSPKLSAFNKAIAHNVFPTPVVTPILCILG